MFKKVNPRQNFPEMEREIINFWEKEKIFEKSVDNRSDQKTYSFFDGPPFATGMPHYGHMVANLMKDVVPRYWTMRGYKVERRWGWDCHGLPIENLIEKEHNIKNKQDIEKWGVDKFNEACHSSVLRYADEWKKFIPRMGRWVDMENDYRTMDWKYTESIWWVFSELYKKGLVYEGYKAMHICPRCETTLSNFEVTQGYKEITDLSATVKFKLKYPAGKTGRGVGALIYNDKNEVLLLRRNENGRRKTWAMPGGKIDGSETFREALEREIDEELGVKIESAEPFVAKPDIFEGRLFETVCYKVKIKGDPVIMEKDKIDKLEWFSLDNLPEVDYPPSRDALEAYKQNKKSFYIKADVTEPLVNVYVLAWTTTPWTLPGNVALAAGSSIKYSVLSIKEDNAFYVLAKDRIEEILKGREFEILNEIDGKELVGLEYEPLFDYYSNKNEKLLNTAGDEKNTVEVVILDKENKILLGLRKYSKDIKGEKDRWIVPGGRSEIGENLENTIRREIKEECNIQDYKIIKYLGSGKGYQQGDIVNWFLAQVDNFEQIKNNEPEKFTEWKFFDLKDVPSDMTFDGDFDYYQKAIKEKNALPAGRQGWKIYAGDFVSTEEGTGIVHIAPAFGDDDMKMGQEHNLPFVQHVGMNGRFKEEVVDFREKKDKGLITDCKKAPQPCGTMEPANVNDTHLQKGSTALRDYGTSDIGREVKPKRNPRETDEKIVEYLEKNNKLFSKENYKHSYPHCWRCDTPLLNYATSSWFVKVTEIKDRMVKNNKQINWTPEYIKDGRFGKWLEDARDWAVSRSRYWGAPLPIWRCEKCKNIEVISSVDELRKKALQEMGEIDLHKPNIDKIKIKCSKCGDTAKIVGDVFDCWFESGSMPYAQWHYPFENQDKFKKGFPAEFIAEGLDQTRGWFYTLMVLSTALFDKPAFKNVIVNGIVQAEDGQKMSKRLKNYPEPNLLIEKYGADSLRYYLLTSPVMKAENLNFSERGVDEVLKRFILTLWNTYSFLVMNSDIYKRSDKQSDSGVCYEETDDEFSTHNTLRSTPCVTPECIESSNLLDKWILSEFNILIGEVNKQMQNYDLVKAARPLREFVDKLSNWYVRRSRKRFSVAVGTGQCQEIEVGTGQCPVSTEDKDSAFQTLHYVLVEYSKLLAPFMPFLAEEIYKNLTDKESVHLEDYPVADESLINKKVSDEMNFVREVVSLGLAIRAKNGIKVRMPMSELRITNYELRITEELLDLIKDELNVKKVEFVKSQEGSTLTHPLNPPTPFNKGGYSQEGNRHNGANDSDWICEEDNKIKIALNTEITEELKLEGQAREIVRHIQVMRKEAKYDRDDIIFVKYNFSGDDKSIKKVFDVWGDYIKKECLAEGIEFGGELVEGEFDLVKELKVGEYIIKVGIRKV